MGAADESQIYRDLMRFKPQDLTPNAWAVKAGVSRAVWADMRRHGNPSRRTLEKLLEAIGSSLAEFEALRIGSDVRREIGGRGGLSDSAAGAWIPASLPALPIVATSLVGEWGEPGSGIDLVELRSGELVDRFSRPISLAGDPGAYGLTIVGKSMWPRFRSGRRVAVSPRAPVAIGDDVVVRLPPERPGNEGGVAHALVGELTGRSGGAVEVRQFNPELTFAIKADLVEAVHKIMGELF